MMSEISKSVAFIITAAILGVAAFSSYWMTKPTDVIGFEKVGQPFFPEFDDATTARSLKVTAYDFETDGVREFAVKMEDGQWRIPSHHNYPAEATERLARTATSLIGLERESIVARRSNKHQEYGVVDPSETDADPESAGQRITLRDEDGDILADYIIGKPAGRAIDDEKKMVRDIEQQDDYFYVRVPDEKETYKARIQIDLSTRFSDWINPDLLKLEAADINRLEIDNYELVEQDVSIGNNRVQTEISKKVIDRQRMTRDGFGPWQLDGLNEQTEEIDTLKIEAIATLLDQMKIVGVRPKMKLNGKLLVKSDLSMNEELAKENPQLFQQGVFRLQQDLERRGFTIGTTENDPTKIALLASHGELRAATQDGVLYTVYFGRSVSGDTSEIEVGASNTSEELDDSPDSNQVQESKEDDPVNEGNSDNASESENNGDSKSESESENRSRFVAIRVDFDITALGDAPVVPTEPAKPEKPEGYDAWKEKREKKLLELGDDSEKKTDESMADESESGNSKTDPADAESTGDEQTGNDTENQDESPDPPADIEAANDEEFLKYEQLGSDYEQAQIQYTTDLELYETANIAFTKREKAGRELVEELNERFAEWFYVVPAESLATLKLTRSDLIKLKESTPPNPNPPMAPGDFGVPGIPDLPASPDINFKMESDDQQAEGDATANDPGSHEDDAKDGSADENADQKPKGAEKADEETEGDGKTEGDQGEDDGKSRLTRSRQVTLADAGHEV